MQGGAGGDIGILGIKAGGALTSTRLNAPRQNDPETMREEGVNVLLAQLLRDHGWSARAERRSRRGVPDVRVNLRGGDLVLLECKWEGQGALLESQLEERLTAFAGGPWNVRGILPRQASTRREHSGRA